MELVAQRIYEKRNGISSHGIDLQDRRRSCIGKPQVEEKEKETTRTLPEIEASFSKDLLQLVTDKSIEVRVKVLKIPRSIYTGQTTVVLQTTRILRKVLQILKHMLPFSPH